MRGLEILVLGILVVAAAGVSFFSVGAPVSITVPFSSSPVFDADLDGDPATGAWDDALSIVIPLDNGEPAPYGTATLYTKHDGNDLYFRVDGHVDVAWQGATGDHFWLGFEVSPTGTSHHSGGEWDGTFFGHTDYDPQSTAVDTNGFGKPPAKDESQDVVGFMGTFGTGAPYAFTAEWKRPLDSGDFDDLTYVADGTTTYNFFVTTDSNGGGSRGGSISHRELTNLNTMRIEPGEVPNEPPTAAFVWSPSLPVEGEEVAFSDTSSDPDGNIVSWEWNFGDGSTSTERNPIHTFSSEGTYSVSLVVTDSGGLSDTATAEVAVEDRGPAASFTFAPLEPLEGEAVSFTDTSESYDGIVLWEWDFGDGGTSSEKSPSHVYLSEGTYTVILTVGEGDGDVDSVAHDVPVGDSDPFADFSWSPMMPKVGESVAFTDESDSYDGIVSWSWDFGDGGTSTDSNPVHVYEAEGTYVVSLSVSEADGDIDSRSYTIEVVSVVPPVASFTFDPPEPIIGETVTFDASDSYDPDGTIVSFVWDFGDGTTGSGSTTTHSYDVAATYTVTLTVTDDDGLADSVSHDVTVNPPPTEEPLGKLKRIWPEWRRATERTPQVLYAKVANVGTVDLYARVVYEIRNRDNGELIVTLTSPVVFLHPKEAVGGEPFATIEWTGPVGIYNVTGTLYYGSTEADLSTVDGVKAISRFAIVPPKTSVAQEVGYSGRSAPDTGLNVMSDSVAILMTILMSVPLPLAIVGASKRGRAFPPASVL
ncbi:MAG: PKD domain-containing protein [Thermoplasmata archaeon]